MIEQYASIASKGDMVLLQRLAERLSGKSFLHINSTFAGGGDAESLNRTITIIKELGINTRWEVPEGDAPFFDITKKIHNALQGDSENITDDMWQYYLETNRKNAGSLDLNADAVLIHDPQPLPLIEQKNSGKWIWRCHIDMSNPAKDVCDYLRQFCEKFDAAIFSVSKFSRAIGIDEFIIPPSIDPLSEKNRSLTDEEIKFVLDKFGIPADRPIILQVSRFDRFKDPTGVIRAFRLVRKYNNAILILAGSPAKDDPEGEAVLNEVREYAGNDPDIYILMLPPFSDREINALQRVATVVLQKSLKEGFGLTVSEAMGKGKPGNGS